MIRKISFCGLMLGMAMAMNFAACDDSDNDTYEGNQFTPGDKKDEFKSNLKSTFDTSIFD